MKKKKMGLYVCMYVCMWQVKGQKNIFFDFSTFAFYVEKSWSWPGSKVKRTLPSGLSIEKARAVLVQRSWVESQKR